MNVAIRQAVSAGVARLKALQRAARLPAPRIGLILGSGFGELSKTLDQEVSLDAGEIPGHPRSSVAGHHGSYHIGLVGQTSVVLLSGRIHTYEGHPLPLVGLPARILCATKIKLLLLTNAAGGLNKALAPGDLMLISDHLNLLGGSPLEGANLDEFGPRFPDLSHVYPEHLRRLAQASAARAGLRLHEGVYAAVRGPQYETPAEVRQLSTLGADAVGMSTVPESIVAAHMGVPVLGLSLITNLAAGLAKGPLSHQEVLERGQAAQARLLPWMQDLLPSLGY